MIVSVSGNGVIKFMIICVVKFIFIYASFRASIVCVFGDCVYVRSVDVRRSVDPF